MNREKLALELLERGVFVELDEQFENTLRVEVAEDAWISTSLATGGWEVSLETRTRGTTRALFALNSQVVDLVEDLSETGYRIAAERGEGGLVTWFAGVQGASQRPPEPMREAPGGGAQGSLSGSAPILDDDDRNMIREFLAEDVYNNTLGWLLDVMDELGYEDGCDLDKQDSCPELAEQFVQEMYVVLRGHVPKMVEKYREQFAAGREDTRAEMDED